MGYCTVANNAKSSLIKSIDKTQIFEPKANIGIKGKYLISAWNLCFFKALNITAICIIKIMGIKIQNFQKYWASSWTK